MATMRTFVFRLQSKMFGIFNQTDLIFQRFLWFHRFSNQFNQRDFLTHHKFCSRGKVFLFNALERKLWLE